MRFSKKTKQANKNPLLYLMGIDSLGIVLLTCSHCKCLWFESRGVCSWNGFTFKICISAVFTCLSQGVYFHPLETCRLQFSCPREENTWKSKACTHTRLNLWMSKPSYTSFCIQYFFSPSRPPYRHGDSDDAISNSKCYLIALMKSH